MTTYSFNEGWKVRRFGDPSLPFNPVTLPHDAMISEPRTAESRGGTNIGWFESHDYEYVKEFMPPAEWEGRILLLECESVYNRAELYLNDTKIDVTPNGYTQIKVRLNGLLRFREMNTLRVVAHNLQPNSRWYSGTGFIRPVWIHVLPQRHILPESISIRTLDYASRTVKVSFELSEPGEAMVEILGQRKSGSQSVTFTLPEADLWSVDHPALHTARLTFGEDVHEIPFGIRQVDCDAENGFRLNGERVILLGACIHHDNGLLGAVGHPFAERRKIALLKKAGFNAIRASHNPVSRAVLKACDELGMLVLDEYVDMWYIHKTQHDYADFFEQNWKNDLALMVEKDRNHPSVVM